MEKLKPCPFCGSDAAGVAFVMPRFGEQVRYRIICDVCGSGTRDFRGEDIAADTWNSRYTDFGEIDFDYSAED